MDFYATAARGTEGPLADELRECGFANVHQQGSGVAFRGERADGWRACLESRIAQRIQTPVAAFPAPSAEVLYATLKELDWSRWLTPDRTLAVSAYLHDAPLTHTNFAALKVKDAVVDHLRDRLGERPSVNGDDPDVAIFLLWSRVQATLYLDLAGTALFQRGYRQTAGEAPLKETLAAALLRLARWDRRQPLLDPMCGSGTIAIEAAMWAADIAPGLSRPRFGFERWADFADADRKTLAQLRGDLRRRAHGQLPRITACDRDPAMVAATRANARAAGVRITCREADVFHLRPHQPAPLVVTNPPYGIRLQAAGDDLFQRELAAALCRLHGWRVGVLTGNPELPKLIPPRPTYRYALSHGALDCDFLV
jgi:23S rRNA G2445 N2-methylase RlmL